MNRACRNEAVDAQHGTGVDGSSHPCTKGYYPKYRFLILITTHVFNTVVCAVKTLFVLLKYFLL